MSILCTFDMPEDRERAFGRPIPMTTTPSNIPHPSLIVASRNVVDMMIVILFFIAFLLLSIVCCCVCHRYLIHSYQGIKHLPIPFQLRSPSPQSDLFVFHENLAEMHLFLVQNTQLSQRLNIDFRCCGEEVTSTMVDFDDEDEERGEGTLSIPSDISLSLT